MRLIIAGARDFTDYDFVCNEIDLFLHEFLRPGEHLIILEGGQFGVDRHARNYAKKNRIDFTTFFADWDRYGLPAGPIRNSEMALVATHALVIWDGESKGSRDMVKKARQRDLVLKQVFILKK